jgi:hypothetical protein
MADTATWQLYTSYAQIVLQVSIIVILIYIMYNGLKTMDIRGYRKQYNKNDGGLNTVIISESE